MVYAGFWKRVMAYLIDSLPIALLVGGVYYVFTDFGATASAYFSNSGDIEKYIAFLVQRNQIRDISFILWLLYSCIMECTPLQATLGKRILGIKVVNIEGKRIGFFRSLLRTFSKLISYIVVGIGFIWIAFNKEKKGWHDMIAKTRVVNSQKERRKQVNSLH